SGINKGFLKPHQMCMVSYQGEVISGEPSTELMVHLNVYHGRPEARCVIHAHPPHAIAYSISKPSEQELPLGSMPEVILGVDRIPIVPYARPGTPELASTIREYLPTSRVMIMARHGVLSWGESLEEAYNGIERVEHSTQILCYASLLGGATNLPEDELNALR